MFASLHTSSHAIARIQSRSRLAGLAARVRNALVLHAERKHLLTLDDARLCDIGMTREQASGEASRPIWDVRRGWRV